jgi:hypothetical protein
MLDWCGLELPVRSVSLHRAQRALWHRRHSSGGLQELAVIALATDG